MPPRARTLADDPTWFWEKVTVKGPDECWPCHKGSVGHQGHRLIRVNGRGAGAHVVSWCLARGFTELPQGWILHHCDNPPCCNPAHLYLGDVQDNVNDMVKRGRHRSQLKTHCKHGHEFTERNTYYPPGRGRACRECQRQSNKRSELRTKQRVAAESTVIETDAG